MDFTAWQRIVEALGYYKQRGFQEVEVAWHVEHRYHAVTCSDDTRSFPLKDYGVLVGSAEQSLIAIQQRGGLPEGRYVALTPCFRDEGPDRDDLHRLYFMKVELFSTIPHESETSALASIAREFMSLHTHNCIETVPTPAGIDLEIAGIEVGSYGQRAHNGMTWTCGTGLAEPRFSQAR